MNALIEAAKEGLRVVVLAIIPVLIIGLENGMDWRLVWVTGAIAGLRFVDKYLHESSKEAPIDERNTGLLGERGLTGF